MRGIVRILAVYTNILFVVLTLGEFVMGLRWSDGWANINRFSAVVLAVAVPPLLALATLRWPPKPGIGIWMAVSFPLLVFAVDGSETSPTEVTVNRFSIRPTTRLGQIAPGCAVVAIISHVVGQYRIGRNLRHLVTLIEDLNALGIAFVSLGEGIDAAALACCQSSTALRKAISINEIAPQTIFPNLCPPSL